MGNRIQKVCTDSQGRIHNPSPIERPSRPSRPFLRFELVFATSIEVASTVLRVWFETRRRKSWGAWRCNEKQFRSPDAIQRNGLIRLSPILSSVAAEFSAISSEDGRLPA
jgi:hypothetical protein